MRKCLLIIDPQNDFCDKKGSLFVPGANEDVKKISKFIKNNKESIDSIFVSLDTHNSYDIAHPDFWVDKDGNKPAPFTAITLGDFKAGKYKPFFSVFSNWTEEYLTQLEKNNRFTHVIWPPHCLSNSWGWQIPAKLNRALYAWEDFKFLGRKVSYHKKGENIFTENYSLFEAEVPYPEDINTHFNASFATIITGFDKIYVAGEARTHCVMNSVKSLVDKYGDEVARKIVILYDAMSDVQAPEAVSVADTFFDELEVRGMSFRSTKERL